MRYRKYGLGEWGNDDDYINYIEQIETLYPTSSTPSESTWSNWSDEDFSRYFDNLNTVPVVSENIQESWFNEGILNEDINKIYSIPLINEVQNTSETTWKDTVKDVTGVLKDIAQIGTPIATTAISLIKANTVTQDNVSALLNSLKQLGVVNQTTTATSMTDLARALGVNVTGQTDLALQQQMALLLAQKELDSKKSSSDDIFKYIAIGLAALAGFTIIKKI